ncbi:MAG TPA: hypothetical protein EYG16_04230 [Deltaproteobacteria bacterium]|nr:hypothetical protein [Candidatus Binatota bacterium]HIL12861.1 hypothetical protein [Deltaproteobacteria bacterium]
MAGIGDAHAELLTKDQQKCVSSLNKGMTKVDATVAKQIAGCLKNHASGKPLSKSDPTLVTLEGCAIADEKGKIGKATQKTIADFQKACVGLDKGGVSRFPSYAATDASTVNGAGTTKAVELSHDIFGADLDSGVLLTALTDKAGAKCQQKVWKAATKCQSTRLKEFTSCAKAAFKNGSVDSAEELENQCQGGGDAPQPDQKGKIAKACLGANGGIGRSVSKCDEGLDLDSLLPGCTAEAHADCVAEEVAIDVCQLINQADGLTRDCGDPTELQYVTGLRAGGVDAPSGTSTSPNPGNLDTVSSNSGAVGGIDPLGPSAAWTDLLEPSGPWQADWTINYSGEIYDADGQMAFREDFDDNVKLTVCGQTVLDDTDWWSETSSSVDCGGGGWHSFELRLHNGVGGAGVANGIGFEWDPAGSTNWEKPQNTDSNTADVFRTEVGVPYSGDCASASCISGLVCSANICHLSQALGGDCTHAHTLCPVGSACTAGTCQMEVAAGGSCSAASTVCASGLSCYQGFCQTEVSLGGDCSAANTYCQSGLICSGGTTCQAPSGNDHLHVDGPVPGLAPSPTYSFRLRSVGVSEWLTPFAFITGAKSGLCTSSCSSSASVLDACIHSNDCATNMYCQYPAGVHASGVCKYDCADQPSPAAQCGDDFGHGGYFDALAGWTNTYINFEMPYNHPVEIEISRVDGTLITTGVVHPARKGTSTVVGGKVFVTISDPVQITVDIDGQMDSQHTGYGYEGPPIHTLTIFSNPSLQDRPHPLDQRVQVVEAGGTNLASIDLNGDGWDILYFEPGIHDIGAGFPVHLGKSYYLPGDAMVYGALRNNDWNDGNNIRIFGSGTLSGARLAHPLHTTPPLIDQTMHNPINIAGAYDTSVEGITIADSAHHSLMLYAGYDPSQPTDIRWVKIFTWRANGDGINPFGNVRIEDSFIRTQDDSSYVGGRGFSRVTMWNDANGTAFLMTAVGCTSEVGCHASGLDAPTVVIEDSDVLYSRGAWDLWNGGRIFSIRAEGGGPGGPGLVFQNIKVHDPFPTLQPFYILTQAGDPYNNKIFSSDSEEKYCLEGGGTWDDVEETCANVTEWNCLAANGAWQGPSTCMFYEQRLPGDITGIVFKNIEIAANSVLGHPNMLHGRADAMISELVFDNVTIGGELIDSPADFCVNEFVGALTFCDANNANCTTLASSGDGLACPCDPDSGYTWLDWCDDPIDEECPTCGLTVTEAPGALHFLTRDLGNNKCQVTVSGQLTGGATEARIRLTRDGVAYSASSSTSPVFSITQTIDAELALYDVFIEWTYSNDFFRTVDQIEDIVCGDAILLDGQSNAQAPDHHDENTADNGVNTFVRSWGTSGSAVTSVYGFNIAVAEAGAWIGSIGQWGLQLANNLKDEHGIPILVFNGAVGGTPVAEHLRDDANPENPDTIYGRLLWRVRQAGVEDAVRAIFWHQGEEDTTMAYNTYLGLWTTMYTAWLEDYPNVEGVFPFQIRAGCGNPTWSRNVQRELPTLLPKVPASMSTTGVSGHDGCHFYSIAYTEWGDRMSRIVSREIYGVTPPGNIDAPNPQSATWTSPTTLEIDYGATGGAMTLQTGAESYFSLSDGATITNVAVVNAKIVITTESASTATWVSMVDAAGDIPWLVNDLGVGGFAYYEFPVTP